MHQIQQFDIQPSRTQMQQQEKIQRESDDEQQPPPQQKSKERDLQAVEKYLSAFPGHSPLTEIEKTLEQRQKQSQKERHRWIEKLKKYLIFYRPDQFYREMKIWEIYVTENKEVLVLGVALGHFVQEIRILNVKFGFSFKNEEVIINPDFWNQKIMTCSFNQNQLVIKRLAYTDQDFPVKYQEAIKQYFFMNIASVLGTGPQMHSFATFDLFICPNQIVWFMEMCLTEDIILKYIHKQQVQLLSQGKQNQLWQALRINHLFNLIHLDIKNDNVAYSQRKNKWIFLDYGISQIIQQNLGFRTMVSYRGSMGYSSPQMIINSPKGKPVDLYNNDAYGLTVLCKAYLKKKNKYLTIRQIKNKHIRIKNFSTNFYFMLLKYMLFFYNVQSNIGRIREFLQGKIGNFFREDMFRFISLMPDVYEAIRDIVLKDSVFEKESFKPYEFLFVQRMKNIKHEPPPVNEDYCENIKDDYKYPQLSDVKKYSKVILNSQMSAADTQKLKKIRFSTGIEFAQKINLISKKCNHEQRALLCLAFLKINKLNDIKGNNPLEKVLLVLYESSLAHDRIIILKNVLDAIILMQIVPQDKLMKDMVALLSREGSFEHKFKHYVCWLQSLPWINSLIKSQYSYNQLLSTLETMLYEYLSQQKQLNQQGEYLKTGLLYYYDLNKDNEILSLLQFRAKYEPILKWYYFDQIIPCPGQQFDWRHAFFIILLVKIWKWEVNLFRQERLQTSNKIYLEIISYSPINQRHNSLSVPLAYHNIIYDTLVKKNSAQAHKILTVFDKFFGSYDFSDRLWVLHQTKMRQELKELSYYTKIQILEMRLKYYRFTEMRNRYKIIYFYELMRSFDNSQRDDFIPILQSQKIQVDSLQKLLCFFPLDQQLVHTHSQIEYCQLICKLALILLSDQEIQQTYDFLINKSERFNCQLCKQQSSNYIRTIKLSILKKNNRLDQMLQLQKNTVRYYLNNGQIRKMMSCAIELFKMWQEHYDRKYRKQFIKLILEVKQKGSQQRCSFVAYQPFMFQQLYFYFIKITVKQPENNKCLNLIVEVFRDIKDSKYRRCFNKLYAILPNMFFQSQHYELTKQYVVSKQIQFCMQLRKNKNPYLAFYIISCLRQLDLLIAKVEMKQKAIVGLLPNVAEKLGQLNINQALAIGGIYYGMIKTYLKPCKRKARKISRIWLKCSPDYHSPTSTFGFRIKQNHYHTEKYTLNRMIRKYYTNIGYIDVLDD